MYTLTRIKKAAAFSLGVIVLGLGAGTADALQEIDLCAGTVTVTMPDGASIPMWGFAPGIRNGATGQCAQAVQIPGPELNLGTDPDLTINLHNTLSVPVSMMITGQKLPGNAGAASAPVYLPNNRVRSLVHEAPAGGSATYTWTGLRPGAFIYQSATHQQVQVQMGLYGGLVLDTAPGTAYLDPARGVNVSYDNAISLFYSEIDPDLHQSVASGCFGPTTANPDPCGAQRKTSTREYHPNYFLVNGQPSDGAIPINAGATGQNILLRLFNAGLEAHVPQLHNMYMSVVAEDGHPLSYPPSQYNVQVNALQTVDVLINTSKAGRYVLFDRALRLSDGSAGRGMIVSLDINAGGPVTPAPTASPDSLITDEDVSAQVSVIANDSADPATALNPASVTLVTLPANGSAIADGLGNVSYTPATNWNGVDSFSYTVSDLLGNVSNVATVSVTVNPVNDAPVAVADSYQATVGVTLNVAAPGVLANDSDIDSAALTAVALDTVGTAGTVTLGLDGSFSYTPAAGAIGGTSDSFGYSVSDGTSSVPTTVTINLQAANPPPANNVPPGAEGDQFTYDRSVNADGPMTISAAQLLANDKDENDADFPAGATVLLVDNNGDGVADTKLASTIVNNGDGTLTYTPPPSGNGEDEFFYQAVDKWGAASSATTVKIVVQP